MFHINILIRLDITPIPSNVENKTVGMIIIRSKSDLKNINHLFSTNQVLFISVFPGAGWADSFLSSALSEGL